ncbi:MAG: hypothetical protein Ta2B_05740 [Termitinemataceae bacterium]|nr:MAG: hypothetical protein Ta2B_05740 [Termitinemataceae bacterium]
MNTKSFKNNISLQICVSTILFILALMFTACEEIPWGSAIPAKGSYTITAYHGELGAIVSDKEEAGAGERVLLAVKPNGDFALSSITITKESGEEINDFENSNPIFAFIMPSEDVTINGVFKTGSNDGNLSQTGVLVSFKGLDATTDPVPRESGCEVGGTVSLPIPPRRENGGINIYIFAGWYTSPDGAGTPFTANTQVTSDTVVYPKWMDMSNRTDWSYDTSTGGMHKNYLYTDNKQDFSPFLDGTYTFELWGASGGDSKYDLSSSLSTTGGKGGYIKAKCSLSTSTTLYIHVGQKGADGSGNSGVNPTYGGGGAGGAGYTGFSTYASGGAGGGATFVSTEDGNWDSADVTSGKTLVAGGGGGGSDDASSGGYGSGTADAGDGSIRGGGRNYIRRNNS